MKKRVLAAILFICVLISTQVGAYSNGSPSITYDGVTLEFQDVQPMVLEGEIFVPLEAFERLGFETVIFEAPFSGPLWIDQEIYKHFGNDETLSVATLSIDYVEIIVYEGVGSMPVNHWARISREMLRALNPELEILGDDNLIGLGTGFLSINVDVAPHMIGNTMMIPIRPIAESVGFEVRWKDAWQMTLVRKSHPELEGTGIMMSLRELEESTQFNLFWDEAARTLEVRY